MAKKSKVNKPILSDHKKVGSRFIPPLLQLSNIELSRWVNSSLPELIWIGLLEHTHGMKQAADLTISLAQTAVEVGNHPPKRWYAPATAYSLLSIEQQNQVVKKLETANNLHPFKVALSSLITLYPECPLKFLFQNEGIQLEDKDDALNEYKEFLNEYSNKYDRVATLAQANAVYIAFVTDILKVERGVSALEDFPDIAAFPNTEKSKRVAASLYPVINVLMGIFLTENGYSHYSPWSRYFWNRGLQLDHCSMKKAKESDE